MLHFLRGPVLLLHGLPCRACEHGRSPLYLVPSTHASHAPDPYSAARRPWLRPGRRVRAFLLACPPNYSCLYNAHCMPLNPAVSRAGPGGVAQGVLAPQGALAEWHGCAAGCIEGGARCRRAAARGHGRGAGGRACRAKAGLQAAACRGGGGGGGACGGGGRGGGAGRWETRCQAPAEVPAVVPLPGLPKAMLFGVGASRWSKQIQ